MYKYFKISICFILISFSYHSFASDIHNPIFGSRDNQLSLWAGKSFRSDGFEKLYSLNLQYSQPNTFFRLPGRRNIEIGGFTGGKHEANEKNDLSQYDQYIGGLSQDVLIFYGDNFYSGVGLGAYIKSESTSRISSKFTFGEKIFVGYSFGAVSAELYVRHYSNGTLTKENAGQNFAGLALAYNF